MPRTRRGAGGLAKMATGGFEKLIAPMRRCPSIGAVAPVRIRKSQTCQENLIALDSLARKTIRFIPAGSVGAFIFPEKLLLWVRKNNFCPFPSLRSDEFWSRGTHLSKGDTVAPPWPR